MNKKMSQAVVVASALVLCVCVFVSIATAHDGDRHGGELSQLNLTDGQRANIQQIETTNGVQLNALRKAVEKQQQAFDAMTPNQFGYQLAAANLAESAANETREHILEHARVNAQIYSILTPSQQNLLAQLKAARAAYESQWEQFVAMHPQS